VGTMHVRAAAIAMVGCAAALAAPACKSRPSDAQLEQWRQETIAVNVALKAESGTSTNEPTWTLAVSGRTTSGTREVLTWKQLDELATAHVKTTNPQNANDLAAIIDFRGVPVSKLIERYGAAAGVDEITFVAHDAFRSTVALHDARMYPILLAIEANGQRISRAGGGPIFLVFPQTDFPSQMKQYIDRYWCFYVTDMIVGTEPVAVRAGARTFDLVALDALPQLTLETKVGYRVHWPDTPVLLHGVRLRDVIAAAGLPAGDVIVRGKAPVQRDPEQPLRFAAKDVAGCDLLLVTRWGPDRAAIPARLGGPVTLAVGPGCPAERYGDKYWVTFVEELVVE
jgi:hypothetical protein